MGDSLEDPTARNHAVAVRLAVDHAAVDLTAAVHAEVILADHIVEDSQEDHTAAVLAVDSQVDHTVVVLAEVVHTEVVHMAMAVIAKSELEHPDLGIHHTTYFAH